MLIEAMQCIGEMKCVPIDLSWVDAERRARVLGELQMCYLDDGMASLLLMMIITRIKNRQKCHTGAIGNSSNISTGYKRICSSVWPLFVTCASSCSSEDALLAITFGLGLSIYKETTFGFSACAHFSTWYTAR
jgi:hypothetical protein